MRYVKVVGSDPGMRFDLLRGKMVYRSSFLSAEEHLLDGKGAEAWASLWSYLIVTPRWIKVKLLPFLWSMFALLGILYTFLIFLDWYLRTR